MPIGHEDVRPAVVVHVEECRAPTDEWIAGLRQLRVPTNVSHAPGALVPVQSIGLIGEIGNKNIQPSVVIEVGDIDSH